MAQNLDSIWSTELCSRDFTMTVNHFSLKLLRAINQFGWKYNIEAPYRPSYIKSTHYLFRCRECIVRGFTYINA